jgi:hypothetical protein
VKLIPQAFEEKGAYLLRPGHKLGQYERQTVTIRPFVRAWRQGCISRGSLKLYQKGS